MAKKLTSTTNLNKFVRVKPHCNIGTIRKLISRIINFLRQRIKGILLRFIIIRIFLIIINYIINYILNNNWGDNLIIGILLSSNDEILVGFAFVAFGCMALVGKGIYKAYHYFFDKPEVYQNTENIEIPVNVITETSIENASAALTAAGNSEIAINLTSKHAANSALSLYDALDLRFDAKMADMITNSLPYSVNTAEMAKKAVEFGALGANSALAAACSAEKAFAEKTLLLTEMAIEDSILNAEAAENLVRASKATYSTAITAFNMSKKFDEGSDLSFLLNTKLEYTTTLAATALNSAASTAAIANKAVAENTSALANISALNAEALSASNIIAANKASMLATKHAILAEKAAEMAVKNAAEANSVLHGEILCASSSSNIAANAEAASLASKLSVINAEKAKAAANAANQAVENVKTEVVIQGGGVLGSIGSVIKDIFFWW